MRKLAVISIHFFAWLIILVLPIFITLSSGEDIPSEMVIYFVLTSLFHPIVFYVFFLTIIPRSIYGKPITFNTIITYAVAGILIYIVKSAALYLIDQLFELGFAKHGLYDLRYFFSDAVSTLFLIALAVLVRIAEYWYRDKREKTELELEEQKLELELLKAQINPHFFFNTLNNIYSLVYKKSDDAPAAVMKLSEIMRYMIYESKADMVPLEKEVEQLGNYIELERLRIKDPDFIAFETRGDLSSHIIPPMLLVSFAENAFKHGKRKVPNPGIIFTVTAGEDIINYEVVNHIIKEPHNNHGGEGIGMRNTRRRLELLYPDCHRLDIITGDDMFIVKLQLKCQS